MRFWDSGIDEILREDDIEAQACLIALMRDGEIKPQSLTYQHLDLAMCNLFFWTFCHLALNQFAYQFWRYFTLVFVCNDRDDFIHNDLWELGPNELDNTIL